MSQEDSIDIKKIFNTIFDRKKTIFLIVLCSALLSLFYSISLPNLYRTQALLEAVDSSTSESSGFGDLGGLASVAGVSIGGPGGGTQAEFAMAITQSRDFFNSLLQKYDFILPSLMATSGISNKDGSVIYDSKKFNSKEKTWIESYSFLNSKTKPTEQEAYSEYIGNVFKVSRNNKTGYLMMTVEHKSPKFAYDLLSIIIFEANQQSREKALEDSSKSLKFLKNEASVNNVSAIDESISSLIEAQLQTQMMAKVHEDYLLKILDSPFIPERKSRPQRAIVSIAGTVLGLLIALIYVLVTSFLPGLINKEDYISNE